LTRARACLALGLAILFTAIVGGAGAADSGPSLVISQVYGGGGNAGATYTHDYIEIFNRSDAPVSLDGLSLQYASATGTGNLGATSTQLTELSGTLQPGRYFLVQQATNAPVGAPLPTPDLIDPTPIAMAVGAGKVALATGTTSLGCNGSTGQPCSAEQLARIVDLVGYGNANFFEGTGAAPTLTSSTAAFRADDGCQDTNENAADFAAATTAPRNTATAAHLCQAPPSGGVVLSEVYGGGGNAGATYTHDFMELRNNGSTPVSLNGWSVQYAAAAGTSWTVTPLSGSIQPGGYYLIRQAAGAGGTTPLPGWDASGSTAMSATAGKVALVSSTAPLTGSGCPLGAPVVDFVGYGAANCFEGSGPAAGTANASSAQRKLNGTQDTDDNAADFEVLIPPTPQFAGDQAPFVSSTSPTAGGTTLPDGTIAVVFSEPVNVTGTWFTLQCTVSGPVGVSVSGGPTAFTLTPSAPFAAGESCEARVLAANVSDQDTLDPPDTMDADHVWTFTVETFECGAPATKIHAIQGSGASTPLAGQVHAIEGVVVGDFQTGGFNGFYVQEEDADRDADPATSEGIFVFAPGAIDVGVGDVVRVRGTAAEFNGLTQLSSVSAVAVCSTGATVTPTQLSLPVANVADHERTEGMLVEYVQTLAVTEVFTLARFGEVALSAGGRLYNPTAVATPGAAAQAVSAENARRRILLDDGLSAQNPDPVIYPAPALSALNPLRVGDSLHGVRGVMDFRFSLYRLQPVGPIEWDHTNPRQDAPDPVGGNATVAAFNVLNYFNGNGLGGGFPTSRGAETPFELERQEAKIVSALEAIDADIVGLMEIENDAGPNSAIAQLVGALNDAMGAGTYAYIDTGVIGGDEIKVAAIYKPAAVTPVGDWKILTEAADPRFNTSRNRPALAQTFRDNHNGQIFTVAVNHLKSKGSACGGAPDDQPDTSGGNCNGTRTLAAAALADWLAGDPTGSGDPDFAIIGDLNSYTFETPIATLEDKGYTNLIRRQHGLSAYSYVFNGESGYLDHALATASLAAQVTGVTEWHINTDESVALDYNTNFKSAGQIVSFYDPGPFRASDHDPVLVGLGLPLNYEGLRNLTNAYVTDPDVRGSLLEMIAAAEAAHERGNEKAKRNILSAYGNLVRAQTGKSITAEHAGALIALASAL
jgi:predicted extracellular nuclease